jgi:1-phosphatidylinositol phosphodiesterase
MAGVEWNMGDQQRLYDLGSRNHVFELAWSVPTWSVRDITKACVGAVEADGTSSLAASTWDGGNEIRVYCVGSGHLLELAWSKAWQPCSDLTASISGGGRLPAFLPQAGTPLAALQWGDGGHAVYYLGPGNHVVEVSWHDNGWHCVDLTAATGGPAADAGSALAAVAWDGGANRRIYSVDTANHVAELAWYSGAWHSRDVTSSAGGPASSPTPLAALLAPDNSPSVYHLGIDDHVLELRWTASGWSASDLSAATDPLTPLLLPAAGSALAALDPTGQDRRVYFVGATGDISELRQTDGHWRSKNLTESIRTRGGSPIPTNSGDITAELGTPLVGMTAGGTSQDPVVYFRNTAHQATQILFRWINQPTVGEWVGQFVWMPQDWMEQLSDDQTLAHVNLPGTHDTGALHYAALGAQCQTMSIGDQLNAGIRFLDIRCSHRHDQFFIYHGVTHQLQQFGPDVLDVCSDFLLAHPTETVVMCVKDEGNAMENTRTFTDTFQWYLTTYKAGTAKAPWYIAGSIPAIGEVRSHIVLVRRFASTTVPLGIDASAWPDDTTFVIRTGGATLQVQDEYTTTSVDQKWTAVKAHLDAARAGNPDDWYINFSSAAKWPTTPEDVAIGNPAPNGVNDRLLQYLKIAAPGRYGTILMDFPEYPGHELIAAVVGS